MTEDRGMLDEGAARGIGKHFVAPQATRRADAEAAAVGAEPVSAALAAAVRVGDAQPGRVYLVGAGPGDPGLITARAAHLIATADVILHDLLIAKELLALARADADFYDVGKVGDGRHVAQEDTNALLVRLAGEGRSVVRVKGGDPFVFGRGGEELAELLEAGVDTEVVAGITSGLGALASAGIPATHRAASSAVAFVTGHGAGDKPEGGRDWASLAAFPGTLVFYMAVKALPTIVSELVSNGRPAEQPAAIVERGTTDSQRVTVTTLAELADRAAEVGVRAPALVVVGDVVGLAGELDWWGQRPLSGKRVGVTRAGEQAGTLASRLRSLGAMVVETPAIRMEPTGNRLPDLPLPHGTLVVVTSPGAAAALRDALVAAGTDTRALGGTVIAAIGPGTAKALRLFGVEPDVIPERAVSEGLLDTLLQRGAAPEVALIIQARGGRTLLADELSRRGTEVIMAHLHEAKPEQFTDAQRTALAACDAILFASGSAAKATATALGDQAGETLAAVPCVAIGPTTAAALEKLGVTPAAVADPHTLDGLVDATAALLRR